MQDDQDNGEFPVSDNPESNQTSYDDEADAHVPSRRPRHRPVPGSPGTGAPGTRRFFRWRGCSRWRECRGSIIVR